MSQGKALNGSPEKRFRRAIAIVASLFLIVVLSGKLVSCDKSVHAEATHTQIRLSWESLWAEPEETLSEEEVSSSFSQEVFPLEEYYQVKVSGAGSIVGALAKESPTCVFESCSQKLRAKGWTPVASGHENVATFIKEGGDYSWLALQCFRVGDSTSLVIQVS